MADVRIVIGRKYEVMYEERRHATRDFAEWLRHSGLSVDLEIIEYEPGRRGLGPIEWTFISIGTGIGVSSLATDLIKGAKRLLRDRRSAKEAETGNSGHHLGFIIHGPDNKEIAKWTTKEEGEDSGDDPRRTKTSP
jgi:hypothetical protein